MGNSEIDNLREQLAAAEKARDEMRALVASCDSVAKTAREGRKLAVDRAEKAEAEAAWAEFYEKDRDRLAAENAALKEDATSLRATKDLFFRELEKVQADNAAKDAEIARLKGLIEKQGGPALDLLRGHSEALERTAAMIEALRKVRPYFTDDSFGGTVIDAALAPKAQP